MSVLTQEYSTLKSRQEAIKQDMLGVAEAIQKLDNSAGKQIAAQIGNYAANIVGIPIKIPPQLGYASLGIFGLIPTIREANKMKKYVARIKELEIEFNENALKLQQIEGSITYDTPTNPQGNKNQLGNNGNQLNKNQPIIWVSMALIVVLILFVWYQD